MTRQRKQAYRSTELSELVRQLKYAPQDKRADVVRHAERFHDELDPAKNYPIDFVVYRLTDRRVPPSESVMLVGEALKPDLRLLIDALSRSIQMPPDPDDPGRTTAELSKELGVSTKTIARWRDRGLRWRWCVRKAGDKPAVVFTRAALQAFEQEQGGVVDGAARFSRMTDDEKERLTARARRLARVTDEKPQAILEHLAKRSGRSVESLRLLISGHDKDDPEYPVFGDRTGPLTDEQKQEIDRAYRAGTTVAALCERYGKTRSTIYRAIYEEATRRVLAMQINVVGSPTFDRDDADEVLLRPIKTTGRVRRLDPAVIASLPDVLRPAYDRPIDSDKATRSRIVRFNYLKHRAKGVQDGLRTGTPRASELKRFDELMRRADAARGEVIAGQLPVTLSVVLRQLASEETAGQGATLQMLDTANAVLLEEIERFDIALSHTFESVLTNRLQRVLAKPLVVLEGIDADAVIARLAAAGLQLPSSEDA